MNKKCVLILGAAVALAAGSIATTLDFSRTTAKSTSIMLQATGSYSLVYSASTPVSEGLATATTTLGNHYSISISGSENADGAFALLRSGGTITSAAPIKGLIGITAVFDEGGALEVGFGNSNPTPIADIAMTSGNRVESAYANGSAYFTIVARSDTTIRSITLDYDCVAPDESVTSLYIDESRSKTAFMVGDSASPSDFAAYAVFGLSGRQRLDPSEYSVSLDTSAEGTQQATISYLADPSKSASIDVSVGSYDVLAADIAVEGEKAIVTIQGSYSNLTADEFKSFNWDGDFQCHGTLNGDNNWDRTLIAPDFTAENGEWSYTVDVTDYPEKYFTAHLAHFAHVLDGDNDLKINAAQDRAKRVKIGDKSYLLNYNLGKTEDYNCWGCLGLRVTSDLPTDVIGTFDGWAGTAFTENGRYLEYSADWAEGKDLKYRKGNWAKDWGYDQIDFARANADVVSRGSFGDNRENNIIFLKGQYTIRFDMWTGKIIFDVLYNPYGICGDITNWGGNDDIPLLRTGDTTYLAEGVTFTAASQRWKIRTCENWDLKQYHYGHLKGVYSRLFYTNEQYQNTDIGITSEYSVAPYDILLDISNGGGIVAFRKTSSFGICGDMTGWADNNDIVMNYDSTSKTYTAKNVHIKQGEHWKIRADGAWGYEFNESLLGAYPEGSVYGINENDDIYCGVTGDYDITLSKNTGKIDIAYANS